MSDTVTDLDGPAEKGSQRILADLRTKGWATVGEDPEMAAWARAALPVARRLWQDPAEQAAWLRCGGTWYAGVNVLGNNAKGGLPGEGVPPLSGVAVSSALASIGCTELGWDSAQISVCFPGYPQPWDGESDAAFRFRRDRDAAHVDGLLRQMPGRRRSLGEVHGFILGVPLTDVPASAAPMVVWEGSHEVMRATFQSRLSGLPPERWAEEDVTDAYVAARRDVFDTCERVTVHCRPGEAYVVHRLALHGVAPWGEGAGRDPRAIAYFRPDPFPGMAPEWWLSLP